MVHDTAPQEATEEDLIKALDKELADIIRFYMTKEAEILGKLEQLDLEIHSLEHRGGGTAAPESLAHLRAFSAPMSGGMAAAAMQAVDAAALAAAAAGTGTSPGATRGADGQGADLETVGVRGGRGTG